LNKKGRVSRVRESKEALGGVGGGKGEGYGTDRDHSLNTILSLERGGSIKDYEKVSVQKEKKGCRDLKPNDINEN